MTELNSLSGRTFELGFKIGFLKSIRVSSNSIVFETQEGRKEENIEDKIKEFINSVSKEKHGEIIYNLIKEGVLDKERGISLYEKLIEKVNIDEYSQDSVLIGHYIVGWHTGYEFGIDFKVEKDKYKIKSKPVFFMFDILQEKDLKGGWRNADIIIHKDKTLHVYDIKSSGGVNIFKKFYNYNNDKKIVLPPTISGFNLYLSFGRGCPSLKEFIENFERITKEKEITQAIELIHISQVFSYLFDFLEKKWLYVKDKYKIEEISVGIINPFLGNSIYKWNVSNCLDAELIKRGEVFKEFYRTVRSVFLISKKDIEESIREKDTLNIFLATEDIKREKERIKEELDKLKSDWITITPKKSIEEIRKEVRDAVKEVKEEFLREGKNMVVGLLHSAGAGKTTSIIEEFLKENKDNPIAMIYIAPRNKLREQIEEKIRNEVDNIKIIPSEDTEKIEKGKEEKKSSLFPAGKRHKLEKLRKSKGNILITVKNLNDTIEEEKKEGKECNSHLFVSLTTQSWLRTPSFFLHTNRHLEKLTDIGKRKLVLVLDEVLGSENGLDALVRLIDYVSSRKNDTLLFILDMNLHSKRVLENILKEYSSVKFLAPSLYITDKSDIQGEFYYKRVPIRVYSGYSFPAKRIKYKCDYVIAKENNEEELLYKKVKEYIDSTDYKVFVYIQDKIMIDNLRSYLENNGYENRIAFFNSLKESEEGLKALEDKNIKVYISTSSLSRGVSLGDDVKRTVIVNTGMETGIENFIAEELQALARMRGGQDYTEKDIVRIIYKNLNRKGKRKEKENNKEDTETELENRLTYMFEDMLEGIDYRLKDSVKKLLLELDEYNMYSSFYSYELLARNILTTFIDAKEYTENIGLVPIPSQYERIYKPATLNLIKDTIKNLKMIIEMKEKRARDDTTLFLRKLVATLENSYDEVASEIIRDEENRIGFCLYKVNVRAILKLNKIRNAIYMIRSGWEEIVREQKIQNIKEKEMEKLRTIGEGDLPINEVIEEEIVYVYIPLYAFVEDMLRIGKQLLVWRNSYLGKARVRSAYDNIGAKVYAGRSETGNTFLTFPLDGVKSLSYLLGNYPVFPKEFVFELIGKEAKEDDRKGS